MIRLKVLFALTVCLILLVASFAFGQELEPRHTPQPLPFSDLIPTPKITVDSMVEQALDDAVVLHVGERAFCSGQLARNSNDEVHVYTAGHCCAVYDRMWGTANIIGQLKHVVTHGGYEVSVGSPVYVEGMDVCRLDVNSKSWYDIVTFFVKYDVKTKINKVGEDRLLFLVSAYPNYDYSQRVQSMLVTGYSIDNMEHRTVAARFYPGQSGSGIFNFDGELVGHAVAIFPFVQHFTSIISILDNTPFIGGE